ncbi:MAG: response regulator/sensory box histidine kinase [Myxococcales bacterium]|nr:response regulator/sensory box histidine kinase [Myxococcales bacterium]
MELGGSDGRLLAGGPSTILDELWLRQVWFARLRWIIPPVLVALGFAVEALTRRTLFAPAAALVLLAVMLAANFGYRALLQRWGVDPSAHAREIKLLAHVQVLGDLIASALAIHFSGGARSEFWPFLSLTVMAAALLFARRAVVIAYAAAATAMCWIVCVTEGAGLLPLNPLMLAALLSMVVLICLFYAERMAESHRLVRSKDEILSRVTHELRTPLSALRGFVYLAQKREASGRSDETPSTKLGQTLVRIDAQVDRLTRMVSDLYDVSSVQAGKLKLEPRACDLIGVVREVALRFRTMHPKLELHWTGPDALWGNWDAVRIDQLLTNLLGNAVKYAGETSVVNINIVPASGASAHIEVSDEGPGIPADKLAVIFEPFQRIDQSAGHNKGLGLGLAIAREIAILHGGAIWVDSQVGRGTTFHVRLPTGGIHAPS